MSVTISGNGDVSGINAVFQTGDWKQSMRKSTPAGWIPASTATIGNVGSGAAFASLTAQALFIHWWTEWTDAELPILTSTGAGSTRGATALADWNALKRLSVFGTAGRFLRVPGAINGVTIVAGVQYADMFKSHGHSSQVTASVGGDGVARFNGYIANDGAQTINTTSVGGAETAPVSIGMPGFWKL